MPKATFPIRISAALYYWADNKRERDKDGKPKESFDEVLRRLTGYDNR